MDTMVREVHMYCQKGSGMKWISVYSRSAEVDLSSYECRLDESWNTGSLFMNLQSRMLWYSAVMESNINILAESLEIYGSFDLRVI